MQVCFFFQYFKMYSANTDIEFKFGISVLKSRCRSEYFETCLLSRRVVFDIFNFCAKIEIMVVIISILMATGPVAHYYKRNKTFPWRE